MENKKMIDLVVDLYLWSKSELEYGSRVKASKVYKKCGIYYSRLSVIEKRMVIDKIKTINRIERNAEFEAKILKNWKDE